MESFAHVQGMTVLAVGIICVVSSGTVGEMNEVVAVVSRLAEGDYGHEIVVQGSDELSHIAQALAGMQEKLRDVLQGVKSSSFTVATAARSSEAARPVSRGMPRSRSSSLSRSNMRLKASCSSG